MIIGRQAEHISSVIKQIQISVTVHDFFLVTDWDDNGFSETKTNNVSCYYYVSFGLQILLVVV